jgi:hypothetical protein
MLVTTMPESPISAQELLERKNGETLKSFAIRVIPEDSELAHKVIVGTFGASPNNIVILFTPPYRPHGPADSNYTGWALIPEKGKAGTYRKVILPPMEEFVGAFEITVKSVFFAQADKDKELELFVLYEYYRNGSGNDYGEAVNIYDWNGTSFVTLEDVSEKLVGLKSAQAVLRKLRTLKK